MGLGQAVHGCRRVSRGNLLSTLAYSSAKAWAVSGAGGPNNRVKRSNTNSRMSMLVVCMDCFACRAWLAGAAWFIGVSVFSPICQRIARRFRAPPGRSSGLLFGSTADPVFPCRRPVDLAAAGTGDGDPIIPEFRCLGRNHRRCQPRRRRERNRIGRGRPVMRQSGASPVRCPAPRICHSGAHQRARRSGSGRALCGLFFRFRLWFRFRFGFRRFRPLRDSFATVSRWAQQSSSTLLRGCRAMTQFAHSLMPARMISP
jgi:hypothetical protein